MELGLILLIVTQHTIFDWLFQTRWMADNKSKNNIALLTHVTVVYVGLFLTALFWSINTNTLQSDIRAFLWVIVNTVVHFCTDFVTSRITSWCYRNGHMKSFWNTISIDQWIHYITLFVTAEWLL